MYISGISNFSYAVPLFKIPKNSNYAQLPTQVNNSNEPYSSETTRLSGDNTKKSEFNSNKSFYMLQ